MRSNKTRFKQGTLATVVMLAAMPGLVQCGKMPGMPNVPGVPAGCPDSLEAVGNAKFGLDADLESKVKAGLSASFNLKALAGKIEGEVTAACSGLAKDLGASDADLAPKEKGPGKSAEAACGVAAKLVGDMKAKVKGQLSIKAKEPRCTASMDMMADCAASCDATVKPGSVDVKCEGGKLSGSCEAECKGTCSVSAGAKCEGACSGECSGACEAGFSGKCDGNCDGKCDGKNAKGACKGTCDGKCTASGSGTCSGSCKGTCSASCDVEAKGKCEGECSGECSVQMKAPKCSGEVKPPEMSADCKANCDAKMSANLECTPPQVEVVLTGSADAEAATKLKAALTKNLPILLKVTVGMKDNALKAVGSVQASLEGLTGVVQGGADAALKVGACVAAAVSAQVEASASINVSVKASASASGSASGGTG